MISTLVTLPTAMEWMMDKHDSFLYLVVPFFMSRVMNEM